MRRSLPLLLLLLPLVFGAWTPFRTGQSWVNGSWYCRAISPTAYHCTRHWHKAGGHLVSDRPAWVSNAAVVSAHAVVSQRSSQPLQRANWYPWGQCTYGAAVLAHDNLAGLGNARDWLWRAAQHGLPTGRTPRVGATVVYQPGVQGASSLGHVAHVVAVYANGSFRVEEMNYYGFGGGFGRFSYRTSWTGWGVAFIY